MKKKNPAGMWLQLKPVGLPSISVPIPYVYQAHPSTRLFIPLEIQEESLVRP